MKMIKKGKGFLGLAAKVGMGLLVAVAIGGCGGSYDDSVSTAEYVPFDAPPIDEGTKAVYLNAINATRAEGADCGSEGYFPPAGPLEWSDSLYRAAYEHSQDMAISGRFDHSGSGTESDWTANVLDKERSTLGIRILNNSRGKLPGGTENIYASGGMPSPVDSAIAGWNHSDPHCAALHGKEFTKVGLAHVYKGDSPSAYTDYWTMDIF